MTLPRTRSRPLDTESPSVPGAADAPSVHVVTFGCQMNKYDSLLVEGRFREQGYRVTEELDQADVVLFNTCSVRDHAEERVYSWVGELKRAKEQRPELVIGVLGCMAQRAEDDIFRRAAHVDIVCGTRRFQHLPELVREVREQRVLDPRSGRPRPAHVLDTDMASEVRVDRQREVYTGGQAGYLAVMRGCNLNCTFCIVPTTRGRVQSRPIDELVNEARWMVAGGAKVITLLGQTIDAYGEDLPRPAAGEPHHRGRQGRAGLADLLYVLQEVDGLVRIRLITLHPSYVTPNLAKAVRDCDKLDRFLPLPAQSGSDDVLKRMKRGYTTDLYRRRIDILRNEVPDIELGSDWIVGFPGETERDFERTLAFLDEIGFAQSYVFKYDPRPGTSAHALTDDVAPGEKKERNQRLLAACQRSSFARHERKLESTARVFVEQPHERAKGYLSGRSQHNLPVRFRGALELVGTEVSVRLGEASAFGLTGVVLAGDEETAQAPHAEPAPSTR